MKQLRAKALRARREMDQHERSTASELICKRVIHSRVFFASHSIACYLPMEDELDTHSIIEAAWRANKRIFVPVLRERRKMFFRELTHKTSLVQNPFGIFEPVDGELISPRNLDIVVTPTVAFDRHNNRIGMGGGYFDRCFAYLRHRHLWFQPKLIGVAFACQEVEEIRPNAWDIRLYRIFSDTN